MAKTTSSIKEAAQNLLDGNLIAFPTETVYGLGALASSDWAVQKVFAAKGRPADHPLIIHLADAGQFSDWASDIPPAAWKLAKEFMPGPLTLVMPRKAGVGDLAAGGHSTVALRLPCHATARELLGAVGQAIVAPSANKFGRPSPTAAEHVLDEFKDEELLVLDGGRTDLGIESTILDLSGEAGPALLRPGAISKSQLEQALGVSIAASGSDTAAPGTLEAHYSPRQPLLLLEQHSYMQCCCGELAGQTVAALGFEPPAGIEPELWIAMDRDPRQAARDLYGSLRRLDATDATVIAVCQPPAGEEWAAVADRLRRAAASGAGL